MSQVQAGTITALNLLSINVYNFWVTEQWHTKNIYNLLIFQKKGFMCYLFPSSFFPRGTAFVTRLELLIYPQCINHCLKSDSWGQMSSGTCGVLSSPQQSKERREEEKTPHQQSKERKLPDGKEWRWESWSLL